MTSPQKQKGSSFERTVAKFLSDTYGEPFVRVPNSGAYVGGNNAHRKKFLDESQAKSFKGDILAPDSWNNFNCECKSYADFPFNLVLAGDCKVLEKWLEQLTVVAEPNDVNLLCMKFNRKGSFVCVQSKITWITDQFMYYTSNKLGDWLIMEFDHFFKYNKDLLKLYSATIDTTSNTKSQQRPS